MGRKRRTVSFFQQDRDLTRGAIGISLTWLVTNFAKSASRSNPQRMSAGAVASRMRVIAE
jgi:hypothetical protein